MEVLKKERIKDRMLKTASKIWGIPENEIESNYDPLVLLMMEACAAEFEKIGYDITASHNRLLDRFADLMLPEVLSGSKPPSCIMLSQPVDANITVGSTHKFFCNQRIVGNKKSFNTDVFFTPIGDFPLLHVSLKNILIGDRLYNVKDNSTKESIYERSTDDSKNVFEIELALTVDKNVSTLNGLSIFFDLRTHSEAQSFYKNLESCKASINGETVLIKNGYALPDQFDLNPVKMLKEGNDYSLKNHRQVAGTYKPQFLHIADTTPVSQLISSTPPESWKKTVSQEALQKACAEPMVYIKLILSRPYPRYVLESLMIGVNAFPVVSRKFNSLNYRTNEWINIIPLQIDGAFLDLDDVVGSTGKYSFRISPQKQELDSGEATVRNSGIGKTNSREVREIVDSLMNAIRDESAYFSDISNDFILNRLREVNHILTRLQDQLTNVRDLQNQYSYVLLKPKMSGETVTIQYWTTNVQQAKQVKAYTPLNSLDHVMVNSKMSYTITSVVGGKTTVSESEKKNYLKQQITSRGQIVSVEDVKLLAAQLFNENLKKVNVTKSIQAGLGANNGFSRVIKVDITLHEDARQNKMEEMQYLSQQMQHILSENASLVYPFQVTLS